MAKTKKPLPFARYVRVSRVGGRSGEGYISIPEQERKMRQLAKTEQVPLTDELFKDEDRSGGNLDRPEFQRALGLIRDRKLGGIAVAKLDRFSRDTEDFLITLREIEQLGGRLLCGDGAVSLQNGTDTFIATVRVAAAALERDQRREDLKKSVRNALDRGVHLSAPYGYRKSRGKGTKLEPHPDEAPVVVEMFELRAAGWTWPRIAAKLNHDGRLPRPYRRWIDVDGVKRAEDRQAQWTPKGVRQLVMNEVYLGTAFNGEHRTPAAHEQLVDPKLYAAANRAKGVKPQGPSDGYLLTGLVRCAGCGYVMVSNAVPDGRRYYRCRPNQHGTPCAAPVNVNADQLEEHMDAWFKATWLGQTWDPDADDEQVRVAARNVERAKHNLRGSLRDRRALGEDATATEIELADELVTDDRRALRDAEDELRQAQNRARGVDLPSQLDAQTFDAAPLPERRLWISSVLACVAVRRADLGVWRQPVKDRIRIVGRDDVPASARLIDVVTRLRW